MERFAKEAAELLNQVLETPIKPSDLDIPPDRNLGDFAYPCFKLSKILRKGPPQIAGDLVTALKTKFGSSTQSPLIQNGMEILQVGPYVNFKITRERLMKEILSSILQGKGAGSYSKLPEKTRERWVLEYSSPNVAKPFQSYHLRPTAPPAALARIGLYRGLDVIRINHLGDWGTQYGKLTVAFRVYKDQIPAEPTMPDLVDIYVKIHQEAKAHPELESEAREAFRKLEQGDPEVTALWKKCCEISIKDFNRIYKRINVEFDYTWGESFYKEQLTPLLDDLRARKIMVESEGAWVIPVTDTHGKELPPCILQKSDGATIYATRDIAAAIYRFKKFKFDRMLYFVGAEQKLHFTQVFAALKKVIADDVAKGLVPDYSSRCEHIPNGIYRFKDGKMSTRSGNFVTLEQVLALAKERVRALMEARAKDGKSGFNSADELEEICEKVAVGAVLFFDLSTDPVKDVDFDLEKIVDFDGETGPYMQYAHTRCLSILRKARESGELKDEAPSFNEKSTHTLTHPTEVDLVKTLGQFPLQLERTLHFAKASQLASYLIDVTRAFGVFYRECHVLGQTPELTEGRLMLVESTRRVLNLGLTLLGIPLPDRM